MKILTKGCEIVAVQNNQTYQIKGEFHLKNEDVELYIFNDDSLKAIEHIFYKDILKKGIKKISGQGGLEIVISQSNEFTTQPQLEEEFNQIAVRRWLNFKNLNQIHQFNQLYRTLKDVYNFQLQNAQPVDDTIETFKSCVDLSVINKYTDSFRDLEQQYIKGQMKWAQIDLENAELGQRIKQLQIDLLLKKEEINKLKYQYEHNAKQLLQSKQQIGDVVNQAIEIGNQSILTKLGL